MTIASLAGAKVTKFHERIGSGENVKESVPESR
jgi:hypothetical protein